jgi:hypothetical protein
LALTGCENILSSVLMHDLVSDPGGVTDHSQFIT